MRILKNSNSNIKMLTRTELIKSKHKNKNKTSYEINKSMVDCIPSEKNSTGGYFNFPSFVNN